jgi:hypothetical protein
VTGVSQISGLSSRATLSDELAGVGRETSKVSIIFAVLFRRSLGLRPRSDYRPDWQALRIMGKRSKEI